MFRLTASAYPRLSPEAMTVCETFLAALPPTVERLVHRVELVGVQTRVYEPSEPFELLIHIEEETLALKTALSIAATMVEMETERSVFLVSLLRQANASAVPSLRRVLENAEREGILLWEFGRRDD